MSQPIPHCSDTACVPGPPYLEKKSWVFNWYAINFHIYLIIEFWRYLYLFALRKVKSKGNHLKGVFYWFLKLFSADAHFNCDIIIIRIYNYHPAFEILNLMTMICLIFQDHWWCSHINNKWEQEVFFFSQHWRKGQLHTSPGDNIDIIVKL